MPSQQASQPQELQFLPYGLPPGYTPPFSSGPTDSHPPAAAQAKFALSQGALMGFTEIQHDQA